MISIRRRFFYLWRCRCYNRLSVVHYCCDGRYSLTTGSINQHFHYTIDHHHDHHHRHYPSFTTLSSYPSSSTSSWPSWSLSSCVGWFSGTKFHTTTKYGVDPALAILIAQVCATEFSVGVVSYNVDILYLIFTYLFNYFFMYRFNYSSIYLL